MKNGYQVLLTSLSQMQLPTYKPTLNFFHEVPMGRNDICAITECSNSRKRPERLIVKEHVGILRWHSPKSPDDLTSWKKQLNKQITASTKVCSNHFTSGYCSDVCRTPTLYLNGYQKDEYKMLYGNLVASDMKRNDKKSEENRLKNTNWVTPCVVDHDYVIDAEVVNPLPGNLSEQEIEIMDFLNQQLLVRKSGSNVRIR